MQPAALTQHSKVFLTTALAAPTWQGWFGSLLTHPIYGVEAGPHACMHLASVRVLAHGACSGSQAAMAEVCGCVGGPTGARESCFSVEGIAASREEHASKCPMPTHSRHVPLQIQPARSRCMPRLLRVRGMGGPHSSSSDAPPQRGRWRGGGHIQSSCACGSGCYRLYRGGSGGESLQLAELRPQGAARKQEAMWCRVARRMLDVMTQVLQVAHGAPPWSSRPTCCMRQQRCSPRTAAVHTLYSMAATA